MKIQEVRASKVRRLEEAEAFNENGPNNELIAAILNQERSVPPHTSAVLAEGLP